MGITELRVTTRGIKDSGGRAMSSEPPLAEWTRVASISAATAAVTVAAGGSGYRHVITGVIASYHTPTSLAGLLIVHNGSVQVVRNDVFNALALDFSHGIRCSDNGVASASLATGGTGVIGSVTIRGYTVQE